MAAAPARRFAAAKVEPEPRFPAPRRRTLSAAGEEGAPGGPVPVAAPERARTLLNVFLSLNRRATEAETGRFTIWAGGEAVEVATRGGVGQAALREDQLDEVLAQPDVAAAELANPIKRPLVMRAAGEPAALEAQREERTVPEPGGGPGPREEYHRQGEGVLIGIVDVEGFDFSHEDFLVDNGGRRETRFVRIWDQGLEGVRAGPDLGRGEPYGSEFRQEHLNRAIAASGDLGIAAYHLEQQSALVPGSHGTHVASIAAGKSGVCPRAAIAAVLIHLPEEDLERERSFTDSTRIVDAVDYLLRLKDELGYKAVSINISLGTNGHAHDGTSGACRWIDSELDRPGRSVCIAAGNAGQEQPSSIDDLGFIVGRIHTSGRVPAAGLVRDIRLEVAGFPIEDLSENEIEIWYSPQDRLGIQVRPPNGRWTWVVDAGGDLRDEPALLADGTATGTTITIFNDLYRPENGSNHIAVFLTPGQSEDGSRHVAPGIWTLRLHGREIRDGRYDGWIERDDPVPVQGLRAQQLWHYPAFFTSESNVDRTSLSTLACTRNALTIGNLDGAAERVAVTSSQGPTRTGQQKPEVCAPGTNIAAACGFHPTQKWIAMSGTSMASPYVAGVAGLMLAIEPMLTPSQIRGIVVRTTRPLPGADYEWRNDAGFGRIDARRCVGEALTLSWLLGRRLR